MKKFYIVRADGSAVFLQPYPEDFCIHCLIELLDRAPGEKFYLLSIGSTGSLFSYLPFSEDFIVSKSAPGGIAGGAK